MFSPYDIADVLEERCYCIMKQSIAKAIIFWVDSEYEYELEIENEDMDDESFIEWIEGNAESLAREDADEKGTTFDEIDRIRYKEVIFD